MFRVGQDIITAREVIITFIIDVLLLILDYWLFTRGGKNES